MIDLLEKTRKLNLVLQNSYKYTHIFNQISEVLNETLESNILLVTKKGKVLASVSDIDKLSLIKVGSYISSYLTEQLNVINKTKENSDILACNLLPNDYNSLIIPIICNNNREGTLIVYRFNNVYSTEDLILGEYGATIIGLEISYYENQEIEEKHRKNSIVKSSISTLSYSELEAVVHIFGELQDKEGLVVASKIADRFGITRSVIVNALRKLESAGVIESRSLGMKGTYIKILNDMLLEELKKLKR